MRSFKSAISLKSVQSLKVHLASLREVSEVFVVIYLLPAGSNSRHGQFGREIEKDHYVRQPHRIQMQKVIEFVD